MTRSGSCRITQVASSAGFTRSGNRRHIAVKPTSSIRPIAVRSTRRSRGDRQHPWPPRAVRRIRATPIRKPFSRSFDGPRAAAPRQTRMWSLDRRAAQNGAAPPPHQTARDDRPIPTRRGVTPRLSRAVPRRAPIPSSSLGRDGLVATSDLRAGAGAPEVSSRRPHDHPCGVATIAPSRVLTIA